MTNLIPPDAKRTVKKEYWIRTLSVWGFLLAICFVAMSVSLFPTYVLYEAQLAAFLTERTEAEEGESTAYELARSNIERANAAAEQLDAGRKPLLASKLLAEVRSTHGATISLDSFSYTQADGKVESITISGTAATRSSLANFAEALKANPFFTTAEVPVQSLIRDSDLPFNIDVGVAKQ